MSDKDFRDWIGRRGERHDVIGERLIQHFTATLWPHLGGGDAVPHGLFWCLAPDAVVADDLGPEGHARLGIHLPPVPYPRRMWAGGELVFHGRFSPGDAVSKTSTIENIAFKTGGSGKLCFVKVRHHYSVAGDLILDERQDIVYREAPGATVGAAAPPPAAEPPAPGSWIVMPTPTLLFRYSALTFNGHRIHYDHPYATGVEGYAGLVVHGPLQATLLLNRVVAERRGPPRRFAYRGLAPLIAGAPFSVAIGQGGSTARVVSGEGVVTMTAEADG